jgi:hypothetical protein
VDSATGLCITTDVVKKELDGLLNVGRGACGSLQIAGVTRVNSTNVLDEGLRIGEIGRRMNSKVNQSNKVCTESKRGNELGLLSICPSPSSPGPYI